MSTGDAQRSQVEVDPGEEADGTIYRARTPKDRAADILMAYRWPLFLTALFSVFGIIALWGLTDIGPSDVIGAVPVEAWSTLWYVAIGSLLAAPAGIWLVHRWDDIRGVEVLEIDPVTGQHRHIRVGNNVWDKLVVRSPWGDYGTAQTIGVDDLQRCEINGRSGYELMDFRIRPDGRPECTATWLGEEGSGAEFRTYKNAYRYAHKRLSKRANRAKMLRANQGEIAREAAEKVVYRLVVTSEKSGMPHGEEVENVVDGVLDDFGLGSPLNDDLGDDRVPDKDAWVPGQQNGEVEEPDHAEADASLGELFGDEPATDVTGGQPSVATDGGDGGEW